MDLDIENLNTSDYFLQNANLHLFKKSKLSACEDDPFKSTVGQ